MNTRTDTATRRAGDVALAFAFLVAIALPALIGFGTQPNPSNIGREFRPLAAKPKPPHTADEYIAWPEQFNAWYRDNFGLRTTLIRWHNLAKLGLFDVSPTTEIVAGPGTWLYTTRDRAVDVFRGTDPFNERELALWKQVLEDRAEWCAQHKTAFVFAIAPNKETIYPERWPARLDQIGATRREQLVEYVARNSNFPLLDLTPALLAAKQQYAPEPVYFPLGTHWNDRGVVYAADALAHRVGELVGGRVTARPLDQFHFAPTDFQDDSWAGRLYLDDVLIQHNFAASFERRIPAEAWERLRVFSERKDRTPQENARYEIAPLAGAANQDWRITVIAGVHVTVDQPGLDAPRAVVFHDSMGEKMRPLLAESFAHVDFRWLPDFDASFIESAKPDVVIQLFVERALAATSLSSSPLDTQERCEREFNASQRVLLSSSDALKPGVLTPNPTPKDGPITVTPDNGALRVGYGGGQLLLPELDLPPGTWPVLRLELESPHETTCMVEYLTRRFTDYSRNARSLQRPVKPGAQVVYIKLRVPDLIGRLRLQPGRVAGDYVIRGLEVRAVPE
jgi:hypothetical protein